MDGGNIEFKAYNKGVVTLEMQGACSGLPILNTNFERRNRGNDEKNDTASYRSYR